MKFFVHLFFAALAALLLAPQAGAACSSYLGKVVFNEVQDPSSGTTYLELRVLDPSVVAASSNFSGWKVAAYRRPVGGGSIGSTTVDLSSAFSNISVNNCGQSSAWIRIPDAQLNNYIAGANNTYNLNFVLYETSGTKIIDVLRLGAATSIYGPGTTYASCSSIESSLPSTRYDAPWGSNGNKDWFRTPDGTGVWGSSQTSNNANSICSSNDGNAAAQIGINKVASVSTVQTNTNFSYTLYAQNGATGTAQSNVVISDNLTTAGLTFVSCTPTAPDTCTYSAATGILTWTVGTVANPLALNTTRTAVLTVSAATAGVKTNTITANTAGTPSISTNVTVTGPPSLTIANASVAEGNSGSTNLTFTITQSATSTSNTTVSYATSAGTATAGASCTAGVDYVTTSGTATIAAGATTATFNVPICGDTVYEPNETFTVTLSSPTNATIATATATGTINDDDAMPSLSIANVSMAEGNSGSSNMTFTITQSAASGYTTTVNYATSNGTATGGTCGTTGVDYGTTTGTATIAAGATTATFTVPICGDTTLEADETFTVTLSGSVNASIATATATGTITNDDSAPTLSIASVSAAEGNSGTSTMTFTVTQSAVSGSTTTVNYATSAGTATAGASCTAGVDYVTASGTVTIAAGATTASIPVTVCGDTLYEANETFTVTLSSPINATIATATATGTITNDDTAPTLSIASVSIVEGNSGTTNLTFTITQSAVSGLATTVNYATSDGTAVGGTCGTSGVDYGTTSGTATVAAGATTTTMVVPICGDTTYEANETFTVTLSSPVNATIATATATGTITNDDTAPTLSIANVSMAEGNTGTSTMSFTVTQSAVSGLATTVSYATSAGTATAGTSCTAGVDYVTASGTVTIAAGATTASIPVTICGDTTVESDETFTVTLSSPTNATVATATATGTILNDENGPDHYELSLPTNSISCLPTTVTVTACANTSSPCTSAYTAASGTTAALGTSGATLGAAVVTFNASGVATTTLSYPTAANGTTVSVSLSGESMTATNARQCCANGTSCAVTSSCSSTFNTAGFIVSSSAGGAVVNIPTQTAGTSSGTFYLRAAQSSTTTAACSAALTGATSVNVAYQCNNPTTCYSTNLMGINGGTATTIQGNPNAGVSGYTAVPMTFDAAGNAPFTLNYSDVGQTTLWFSKVVNGATLTGASNAFVTIPGGFLIAGVKQTAAPQLANPGSAASTTPGATDAKFIKAGEAFGATVSAVTSGGTATPNYGRETTPEGVLLTHTLVAPSGGNSGTLSNGTIAGGSFTNGVATVTNLAWDEVGFITLSARVADSDYLGAGNVSSSHGFNIGRFIPDHFAITAGTVVPACSNAFTYFGQDYAVSPASSAFSTPFTLTAQNLSNGTTQNYTDGYAKLALTAWGAAPASAGTPGYGFSAATLPTGSALSASVTAPTGSWPSLAAAQPNRGVASITAKHKVSRPTALTGITSLIVSAAPVDSDGVAATATAVGSASNFYYGRLRMVNAYGSELLVLPMSLTSQVWNGTAWVLNALDSCTSVPVPTSASGLVFGAGNLSAGETVASINGTTTGNGAWIAGDAGFKLSKPGAGNNGFVTVTIATPDWLKFPWVTAGVDVNASARASFGIFKSPLIYRRENY